MSNLYLTQAWAVAFWALELYDFYALGPFEWICAAFTFKLDLHVISKSWQYPWNPSFVHWLGKICAILWIALEADITAFYVETIIILSQNI